MLCVPLCQQNVIPGGMLSGAVALDESVLYVMGQLRVLAGQ